MEKYGLRVELEKVPGSAADAARFITEKFLPLHKASWDKEKKPLQGYDYDPNISAIMQMWIGGALKIVMLYAAGTDPVGYLLALDYRPITHNARLLQVEDYYVDEAYSGRGEKALIAFVQEMASMTGCHEIRLAEQGDTAPQLDPDRWAELSPPVTMRSFVAK